MAVMLKAGKYNKVITIEARNYPRERETNLHGEHKAFWKHIAILVARFKWVKPSSASAFATLRALQTKCGLNTVNDYLIFIR